jgi:hypothetical protein
MKKKSLPKCVLAAIVNSMEADFKFYKHHTNGTKEPLSEYFKIDPLEATEINKALVKTTIRLWGKPKEIQNEI